MRITDVLKALDALATIADDAIDEALEMDPSPEKAEMLMETHITMNHINEVVKFATDNADTINTYLELTEHDG